MRCLNGMVKGYTLHIFQHKR